MGRATTLAFLLCSSIAISAQSTFERVYGGAGYQLGHGIQQTLDGGYVLSGSSATGSPTGTDMLVIKLDENGDEQWSRTYGTLLWDVAFSIREVTAGGYIICGVFSGLGTDSLTLIRTNDLGDVQWERQYPGSLGRSIGYCVQETLDGGFVATGFTGPNSNTDIVLLRVDADGVQQWRSAIDMDDSEYGNSVLVLPDGGYMVLADNGEFGSTGVIRLLRFDADGDTTWTRSYGTPDHDHARGLCMTDDGGFLIAGGSGYPDRNILLLRTDAQGNELWRRIHGEPDRDELATDVQQLDDGGFVLGGRKENSVTGETEMLLFAADLDGYPMWERTFHRGIFSVGNAIDHCSDGGFVLLGSTSDTTGTLTADMYLVKTDAIGIVGLNEVRDPAFVVEVFPNPASDRFMIRSSDGPIRSIALLDATGRQVLQHSFPWTSTADVDVSQLANGRYTVLATADEGRSYRTGVMVVH